MKSLRLLIALFALGVAACASANNQQTVQIPTLAVLPSETRDPSLPTLAPTVTPTVTLSPIPSPTQVPSATPAPPCDMAAWWKVVEPTVTQFLDTVDIAGQTPRASLSTVLLDMQQTYRQFQRADHPDCAGDAYNEIVAGMSATVQGYTDFLGQLETLSNADLETASAHFWAASHLLYPYGVNLDPRAVTVSLDGLTFNGATVTQIATLGVEGLSDQDYTEQYEQLQTQIAQTFATTTAIFSQ